MPKCELKECENDCTKPTSTAFERRYDTPNIFSYFPRKSGNARSYYTRTIIKYFCSAKCMFVYIEPILKLRSEED